MRKPPITSYFVHDPDMSHAQRVQKLRSLRDLSPSARNIPFEKLDPQALRLVEDRVLSEARDGAHTSGRLFETEWTDASGRPVTSYEGSPKAWLKPFMARSARIKINPRPGERTETVKLLPNQRVQIVG
jgi:hypothetical protein